MVQLVGTDLLLVLALGDEARLDAVARLEEGAALRQLARVVRHDARQVARDQRRHRAVDLLRTSLQCTHKQTQDIKSCIATIRSLRRA